jgi:hypothetical protein
MNIIITIGDNDRTALVLPANSATALLECLATAKVFKRDGYYASSGWKPSAKGVAITYSDGAEFQPTDPRVAKAEKETEEQRSNWYKEHTRREALEKELAESKAALEAIKAVTVCKTVEPEPPVAENDTGESEYARTERLDHSEPSTDDRPF